MPQIAPPTQPTVSVQVPVPTPVEPAPQSQPAAARPNQDFLDGYAAALQQQGKGKEKDEEPPADPDAKPAAVSLPPQRPDTDRRQQVVPHTLIFPYLPPPRKRFRPRTRYSHKAFGEQMRANMGDGVTPLVWADYLDESGHPEAAEVVREHIHISGKPHGPYAGFAHEADTGYAYNRPLEPYVIARPSGYGSPLVGTRTDEQGMTVPRPGPPERLTTIYVRQAYPHRYPGGGAKVFYHHFFVLKPPAESHRLLSGMARSGLLGANDALRAFHAQNPHFQPAPERMARPRKFARYRDIAAHPDNVAFHQAIRRAENSEHDDPLPHLVYADWLEEHGHTGMAQVIRQAADAGPSYTQRANPADGLAESVRGPLKAGQPTVHVYGAYHRGEQRQRQLRGDVRPGDARVFLHLRVPDPGDPGFYRTWQTPPMERGQVAGLLRQLKAEGVAHTIARLGASGPVAPAYRSAANLDARQRPTWKVDAAGEGYTTRPPEPPTRFRKRKYAAQRAWATWQSLHPEIRHTPLGAALVHVANGHGGDETATHLAYAAVHHAGEHDSPMKLDPIGVLADYLEDSNPGHPLARAFNLNQIVDKLGLDRVVEAHAAQMAHGADRPAVGHDWTHYELNNIKAGSSPESPLREPLARAVAAAQTAGYRATPEDVARSAARTASRRFLSLDVAHRIWNPDDYHDQVGRQVMTDASPTAVTPAGDPRRFARAVAASIGAS